MLKIYLLYSDIIYLYKLLVNFNVFVFFYQVWLISSLAIFRYELVL